MACKVKVNRHGFLAFRLYWDGKESWEGTEWKDTPKNRSRAEARAVLISEQIDSGTFDYLKWFPEGNKAHLFRAEAPAENKPKTVGEFYRDWIERKKRLLFALDCITITIGSSAGTFSRSSRRHLSLKSPCLY